MPVPIQTTRFGSLELSEESVVDFPDGLIGLGGHRYAVLSLEESRPFAWLQSLEDPALALPVVSPWAFFPDFELELSDAEASRIGLSSPDEAEVYVTVRARADVNEFTANLRAPLLIASGRGHQVLNEAPHAAVRAPLFGSEQQAEPVTGGAPC